MVQAPQFRMSTKSIQEAEKEAEESVMSNMEEFTSATFKKQLMKLVEIKDLKEYYEAHGATMSWAQLLQINIRLNEVQKLTKPGRLVLSNAEST